jgi:hypothetical protein
MKYGVLIAVLLFVSQADAATHLWNVRKGDKVPPRVVTHRETPKWAITKPFRGAGWLWHWEASPGKWKQRWVPKTRPRPCVGGS